SLHRAGLAFHEGISIMRGAMKVGVVVMGAVLAVLLAAWWMHVPPAATAFGRTSREARERADAGASRPASTSSESARAARDEMRAPLAGRAQTPRGPRPAAGRGGAHPAAGRAAPAAAPATQDAEGGHGHYDRTYIQEHFREDMFPLLRQCYDEALSRKPRLG